MSNSVEEIVARPATAVAIRSDAAELAAALDAELQAHDERIDALVSADSHLWTFVRAELECASEEIKE